MAGTTGAPWNLPYLEPSDAPKDMPGTDRQQMEAIANALSSVTPGVTLYADGGQVGANIPTSRSTVCSLKIDLDRRRALAVTAFGRVAGLIGDVKLVLDFNWEERHFAFVSPFEQNWFGVHGSTVFVADAGSYTLNALVWGERGIWKPYDASDQASSGLRLAATPL